jgi:peptide/nickel transport system permease protein
MNSASASLKVGAAIVVTATTAAVVGPLVAPFDTATQELALRLAKPSLEHPLGLDELGRDMLARILAGARISLAVSLTVVGISSVVGTALGAIAGYCGGFVDDLVSRLIDTLLAFPGLLLAIALVAVLGPSLLNVLAALTVIGWVGYARLVRAQVLRAREFGYVQAAQALGVGPVRILWHHLVPAALPAVAVQAALGMAGSVIGEGALSFLGLGVQPPTPSWGAMLNGGRAHILEAPHLTVVPGLAIALLVLGFNCLGEGLRDLLDPRAAQSQG